MGPDPLLGAVQPEAAAEAIGGLLGPHLQGRELGTWAIGSRSLEFIRSRVSTLRPQVAIEFGSGISTAVLALAMRDAAVDPSTFLVVSFEQDERHAADTRQLVEQIGLGRHVVVVFAPLKQQTIEGLVTTCYSMPLDVHRFFNGRVADLVIIDGPSAESGARFGTLPLVKALVSSAAEFILDDAVRDGELYVAKRWDSLPYIRVDGIRLIERGLLTGAILGGRSSTGPTSLTPTP